MKLLRISALSAICALAQIQLLEKASGLDTNLKFAMAAVIARKEWSGFRSRLLGPELVRMLGGDHRAFLIVTFAGLVIGGVLAWRLAGAFGLAVYHAGFALLANPWFAPWDIFEPVIFTAFVIFVVESKPESYFVTLFSVAIFNLQTAMFIPLWMIISR
ncbi:MAG TPA: hypothetical protein VKV03_03875, partial [Candidatus Binataceae bacterium]|nr:hypothetical protein [Candidatus Binataceae bacterium]